MITGRVFYRLRRLKNRIRVNAVLNEVNHGSNCIIGDESTILGAHCINIGDNFCAGNRFIIEAWEKYRGESIGTSPIITIGDNVSLMDDCQISCMNKVVIGNGVLIGKNVFITDNFHGQGTLEEMEIPPIERKLYSKGAVVIGDNVWIGRNVCVMPGVSIGKGSIIGANAVVTHDVPDYSVAVGAPAKIISERGE